MAINFPNSPAVDDVYTHTNGRAWRWTGVYWAALGYFPDLINSVNTWKKGNATNAVEAAIVSGSVTIDCSASNVHKITLTENIALNAPINGITGQVINIMIVQNGTGGKTLTFNSAFKFPGGNYPSISSSANAVDILTCQYDFALGVWYCVLIKNYL